MEAENTVNIEVFKGLITTAPAILEQNKDSVSKAETYGNQLIAEVQALKVAENGRPNFEARKIVDVKLESYLKRINDTVKLLKDRRTPITGLFDDFKKMYTSLEAKIDSKTVGTFPNLIQNTRNVWATDLANENKRVADEQAKIRNIESEKIRVKSEIELQLKKYFLQFAENEQQEFIKKFEALTLIAFDFEAESIKNYNPEYPAFHFDSFKPVVHVNYIDSVTIESITSSIKKDLLQICQSDFKTTLLETKRIKVEQLESKRAELQEIANTDDAAEKKRLEDEAEQRKKDEATKIATETAQKNDVATSQATTVQQVANTNLLFELQAVQIQPTANVKEGIEIIVKAPSGYLQIVAFYFEKQGLKQQVEDLEKLKLGQMKTWCEKHTMKTGEKITSIALEYKDVYRAVNKK